MEVKQERIIAYCLAAVMLVMGVVCYAAFPEKTPEEPVRIMLKSTGGNVLFDHKEHVAESGYEIACVDCHHDIENEGDKPSACGECHLPDDEEESPKRSDAFHSQCKTCHEEGGGPVDCAQCHAM